MTLLSSTDNFPTQEYEHLHRVWLLSHFKNQKCQYAYIITTSPYKKQIELSQKEKEDAQHKAQINTQKQKELRAKKEKKSWSTQEAKRGIFRGKRPSLSTRRNNFKKRLCNEEDEITFELGGTDDAQPLPGNVENTVCMFCTGVFSEDNDSDNWICCGICFKWSHTLCANFEGLVSVCDMDKKIVD
jgi:hypothetical protein